MPSSQQVRAAVEAYLAAIHGRDRSAFLELFTDDVVAWDPYPGTRFAGPEGVVQWWDTMIAPMSRIAFDVQDLHVCGDRGVMVWSTTSSFDGGEEIHLKGVDVFTVTDGSKISSLCAYWDPARVTTDS